MRMLFVHVHDRLFRSTGHPRHHLAPLDLGNAMGCATAAGHTVDFVETSTGEVDFDGLLRRLGRDPAELVVLKPTFEALEQMTALVAACRPRERTVLMIGPPVAHAAEKVVREAGPTVASLGEPDTVPNEIAEALTSGPGLESVPGLALSPDGDGPVRLTSPRPLNRHIDDLPLPRHDLLVRPRYRFHYPLHPRGRLKMGYIRASRGCPYACIFCSEVERASFGKAYRTHGPERVAREFLTLQRLGVNGVYLEDDLFAINRQRALEVCAAITGVNERISWCCQVRAGDVDDEMAEALRRAGCASVACGVESGSDRILGLLRKGTTVAAMRKGAAALRRAGVQLVAYLIIGVPTETEEERAATLRLADELGATMIQLHIFASYPGTQAMEQYPDLGLLGASKFHPALGREDHDQLIRDQRRFYRRYYFRPDRFVRHALRRFPQVLADPTGEVQAALHLMRHVGGA